MPTLSRVRVNWIGSAVTGGGVSTFYSTNSDPSALVAALKVFFGSFNGLFPSTMELQYPGSGETIDETSGAVNGAWAITPPSNTIGAGGNNYAAGVGCRIRWNTAAITRRRRVRGSTYLVPIVNTLYDTTGTIDNSSLALIQGAIPTLLAADSGSIRVYSRPQTTTSNDGAAHPITSGLAVDKVSWLRSRRT